MFVKCYCEIQDLVLKNVIDNYILKTPFLRAIKKEAGEEVKPQEMGLEADIMIVEMIFISKEKLEEMTPFFKGKPLLILTRQKGIKEADLPHNVVVSPKPLTYQEFVQGLGRLVNKLEII